MIWNLLNFYITQKTQRSSTIQVWEHPPTCMTPPPPILVLINLIPCSHWWKDRPNHSPIGQQINLLASKGLHSFQVSFLYNEFLVYLQLFQDGLKQCLIYTFHLLHYKHWKWILMFTNSTKIDLDGTRCCIRAGTCSNSGVLTMTWVGAGAICDNQLSTGLDCDNISPHASYNSVN